MLLVQNASWDKLHLHLLMVLLCIYKPHHLACWSTTLSHRWDVLWFAELSVLGNRDHTRSKHMHTSQKQQQCWQRKREINKRELKVAGSLTYPILLWSHTAQPLEGNSNKWEAFWSNFLNNYDLQSPPPILLLYFIAHHSMFYTMILSPLVISNTADIIITHLQCSLFFILPPVGSKERQNETKRQRGN